MKEIKELLLSNPIHIENIFTTLGFYKVHKYKQEIMCCNSEKGTGASIHIKLNESISCKDYKYGEKGDIFSFLMKKRQIELMDVLNIVKQELGLDSFTFSQKPTNIVFGGAYRKIKRNSPDGNKDIVLPEDILIPYANKLNMKFLRDGINFDTQRKFQIGLDPFTQRITIPWRNMMGELIGVMGRYIGNEEGIPRWLPVIPFPKLNALYGYATNYKDLVDCAVLYAGESEKFTLQLDTMEINNCISIGRSEISSGQIKRIISLNPKKIIYCMDEGLSEEISIKNVKLTQQLLKYHNIEVGYIYDEDNKYLPKGSKSSPTDLGKDVFLRLVTEKVKEVLVS